MEYVNHLRGFDAPRGNGCNRPHKSAGRTPLTDIDLSARRFGTWAGIIALVHAVLGLQGHVGRKF